MLLIYSYLPMLDDGTALLKSQVGEWIGGWAGMRCPLFYFIYLSYISVEHTQPFHIRGTEAQSVGICSLVLFAYLSLCDVT